jgi:hypothetical protein
MTKISDRALAACPAIPGHAVAVCICEKIQAALDAERADAAVCVRAEIAREMRADCEPDQPMGKWNNAIDAIREWADRIEAGK